MRLPLLVLLLVMIALVGTPLSTLRAEATASPQSFARKNVLITGSTDGLGRELALALAAEGAHVIVHGRNAERGQAVVDAITASGTGSARFYAADFARCSRCEILPTPSPATIPSSTCW